MKDTSWLSRWWKRLYKEK